MGGTRHVSHGNEPSFAQSMRRGTAASASSPYAESEYDRDQERSRHQQQQQGPSQNYDFDYNSPFVRPSLICPSIPYSPLTEPQPQDDTPPLSEREALETELIRRLISSYFNIVRESIADQVPKAVMHLLVNHSKDVVQNRLVSELYREEMFEELLYEDDAIKQEREKCERLLKTYREAGQIVGEVL